MPKKLRPRIDKLFSKFKSLLAAESQRKANHRPVVLMRGKPVQLEFDLGMKTQK